MGRKRSLALSTNCREKGFFKWRGGEEKKRKGGGTALSTRLQVPKERIRKKVGI